MRVTMILPALTEATSPFFRPIKYALFPPLGLATLAGYRGGLRDLVPDIAWHDVYVCGPESWMAAAVAAARVAGVPEERIHLERFAW